MKKITSILLAALFTVALATGCAGKTTNTSNTTDNSKPKDTEADSSLLSKSYADLMKTGKYYMHYTAKITNQGQSIEAENTMATDGKSTALTTVTSGTKTHIIVKDKTIYMLNDSNKTYFKMSIPDTGTQSSPAGSVEDSKIDTSGITYVGRGKAELNGKTLNYEEYKTDQGTLRYYFDGNKLYAIVDKTSEAEVMMVIVELSDKVTADMLEIPAGYTQSNDIAN